MEHQNPTIEQRYTLKDLKAISGGTSHTFIYNQIKQRKLAQPEKWGRSSRWKESDVKAWLATFSNPTPNSTAQA